MRRFTDVLEEWIAVQKAVDEHDGENRAEYTALCRGWQALEDELNAFFPPPTED